MMKIMPNKQKFSFSMIKGVSFGQRWKSLTNWVQNNSEQLQNHQMLPSVKNFAIFLQNNRKVRNFLKQGLQSIPKTVNMLPQTSIGGNHKPLQPRAGILYGKNISQFLSIINSIAQKPPQFQNKDITGVPFYSIFIDLLNNYGGQKFFENQQMNNHLRMIMNDYADMLKSQRSLKYMNKEQGGWFSPNALKKVNYQDFVCDPSQPHYGFQNWNDWFTRALKPHARPIDNDPNVIVNTSQHYPLTDRTLPIDNVSYSDQFWLKDNSYSLEKMFEAQKFNTEDIIRQSFVGGKVYQGFLNPWCYHRWHAPVSGTIEKVYHIPGYFFYSNPYLNPNYEHNYCTSQPTLSATSNRQIYIIKADNPKIGRIGIVQIGMVQVSGCRNKVQQGQHVEKGDELGLFQFGGSSHAIIFDKKANLKFNTSIYDRDYDPLTGTLSSKLQKINTKLAQIL